MGDAAKGRVDEGICSALRTLVTLPHAPGLSHWFC
jgi:hypothetical protein